MLRNGSAWGRGDVRLPHGVPVNAEGEHRRGSAEPRPLIDDDLPLVPERNPAGDSAKRAGRPPAPERERASKAPVVSVAGVLALVLSVVFLISSVSGDPDDTSAQAAAPVGVTGANPEDSAGADELLAAGRTLPRVRCDLPELGGDREALRAFYLAEIECLEQAWRPVIEEVDRPFTQVGLRLSDDAVTKCGLLPPSTKVTALYCGADEMIYLPMTRVLNGLDLDRSAHLATLAHEYGHHVQRMSGIMDRVNAELGTFEAGSDGDLALGRRFELQANCFAGLFLESAAGRGSISGADARAAVEDFHNWADSSTHGTRENQADWARKGFEEATTAACDTRSASATEIR